MRTYPEISVCMVFYNTEKYIKEAIDSTLAQSFQNFEFVIVSDGSTDKSSEIVKSYDDQRIRYFENKNDYIDSLNVAYGKAKGKYIVKMDSDDIMMPDRLLVLYNYMEANPDIAASGSGFQRFGQLNSKYIPNFLEHDEIVEQFCKQNCFAFPIIRRDFIVKHCLLFTKGYESVEDYRLWADIAIVGGKLANLPRILLHYRIHEKQITNEKYYHMSKQIEEIQSSLKKYIANGTV